MLNEAERLLLRIKAMQIVSKKRQAAVLHDLGIIAYRKLRNDLASEYFSLARKLGHPAAQHNLQKLGMHTIGKGWCSFL